MGAGENPQEVSRYRKKPRDLQLLSIVEFELLALLRKKSFLALLISSHFIIFPLPYLFFSHKNSYKAVKNDAFYLL